MKRFLAIPFLLTACGQPVDNPFTEAGPVTLVEFEAVINPGTGTFEIAPITTQRGLLPLNVQQDGTPGTGPLGSIELVSTNVGSDGDGSGPCGVAGTFCADVTIRSFYSNTVENIWAEIISITPPSGHDGRNSDVGPPGLSNTLGLWGYGNIASNGSFMRQWIFGDNGTNYVVRGRVVSDTRTMADFDTAFDTPWVPTTYSGASAPTVMPPTLPGDTGNYMRLVPAIGGAINTIGFDRTFTGVPSQITADFDFRMNPGSGQADGIGFALLNTANYGTTGASPAISEEVNLPNSFGIGLDNYNNGSANDPDNNHLSIHYNSAWLGSFSPPFDFSDTNWHHAQFIFTAGPGQVLVDLFLTPVGGGPIPLVTGFLVPGTLYESRVAFGARTGGQSADHDIDNLVVQYLP